MAVCRQRVRLQSDGWACWYYYRHCACGYDLDPIQGQRQGHGAFELPKISETVHTGGDYRQPPYEAFWLVSSPYFPVFGSVR